MWSGKLRLTVPLLLVLAMLSGCTAFKPMASSAQEEQDEQTPGAGAIEPVDVDRESADGADENGVEEVPPAEPVETMAEPEPVLRFDKEEWSGQKASMASGDDVRLAFSALHQVVGGAFMESVIERVESIMGLEFGKEGSGRVYRCPEDGYFVHSREEFRSRNSGESAFLFEFDHCKGSFLAGRMITLNGSYSRRIQATTAGEDLIEVAYDLEGVIHEGREDKELRLRGTQDKRHPAVGGVIRFTPALEFVLGDDYIAMTNFTEKTLVSNEAGAEFPSFSSTFETVYEGRLVSSAAGGYVDITTPVHLVRSYPPCAAEGLYRFSGVQSAEIRFGDSTNTPDRATIEIDNALMESYGDCQEFAREIGRIGM